MAYELLKTGDRVVYSNRGIAMLIPKNRDRIGTVTNYPSIGSYVHVRWDGQKTAGVYHADFIKRESEMIFDWNAIREAISGRIS